VTLMEKIIERKLVYSGRSMSGRSFYWKETYPESRRGLVLFLGTSPTAKGPWSNHRGILILLIFLVSLDRGVHMGWVYFF
jgi:hypothetical protein